MRRQRIALCLAALLGGCRSGSDAADAPQAQGGASYPNQRPRKTLPARAAVIALRGEDRLAVVDRATRSVVGRFSVGRDPVSPDGPSTVAVDQNGAFYTLLAPPTPREPPGPHAARASKERVAWLQKLAGDDLRPLAELRVGPYAGDLAASDDGARLVASHFDLRGSPDGGAPDAGDFARATVLDIPTATLRPFDSPDPTEIPACVGARGVSLSPGDGRTAYVACAGEDALAVVDLVGRAARRFPLPPVGATRAEPAFVARTSDGSRLAIACAGTRDLRFFDVRAEQVLAARSAPFPGALSVPSFSPDGGAVYLAVDGGGGAGLLAVVDAASGATRASAALPGCVRPAQVLRDGDALEVLCEGDGEGPGALLFLDAASLALLGRVEVGVAPSRMALVPP